VDPDLVNSMIEDGFTSVINVRKDGPNLEVVVGRRRVKAARRANEILEERGLPLIKVQCEVVKGNAISLFGRVISENALRKDVHPIDMADDLQRFLDFGATEEEAGRRCGKTIQQLRITLKLLDLDEVVQKAIRDGVLSVTAGIKLADLTRADQKTQLAKVITGQAGRTVAAVASVVKANQNGGDAVQAPGKRLLKKLLASDEAVTVFGEDGIKALRFAMGDLPVTSFAGLTALIREVKSAK
jgi:ParB family chromosome partitioning protein